MLKIEIYTMYHTYVVNLHKYTTEHYFVNNTEKIYKYLSDNYLVQRLTYDYFSEQLSTNGIFLIDDIFSKEQAVIILQKYNNLPHGLVPLMDICKMRKIRKENIKKILNNY